MELYSLLLHKARTPIGFYVEDMIKDHSIFHLTFFFLPCGDYYYSTIAQITSLRNMFLNFKVNNWFPCFAICWFTNWLIQRRQGKAEERGRPFHIGRWPWPIYLRWWQCWELPCLIHVAFLLAILGCWNTMGRAYNTHLVQFLDSFQYQPEP